MTTQEKVIDKIQKLMRHQESAEKIGSREEAAAFAAKIQSLLIEHEIEMSQISLEQRDAREETIDRESFEPSERGWTGTRRQLWLLNLARAVASAHMCRLLISRNSNTVWFVGKPANRAVCIFMYEYLIRSARNLNYIAYTKAAREHKKEYGDTSRLKGFISSFYEAFAMEIGVRYEEIRRAADVVTSTALVLRSTEVALEKYMSQFTGTSKAPASKSRNFEGAAAGRRTAREINLNVRGVNSGRESKKLS